MQILTLVMALAAIIYALVVKFRCRMMLDFVVLLLSGAVALANGAIVYVSFTTEMLPLGLRALQQVLSCMIVPLAYMYFAHQMGRKWNNSITVWLWGLTLILLIPYVVIPLDGSLPQNPEKLFMMRVYLCKGGSMVNYLHTADIVILVQGLLTLSRMIAMGQTMRKYRLKVSRNMRYFLMWWLAAVVFIAFTSFFNTDDFHRPLLLWIYFIMYATLMCVIFVLFALNFDLHPIVMAMENVDDDNDDENDDEKSEYGSADMSSVPEEPVGEVAVKLDSFIMQSRMMAQSVRQAFDGGEYLKAGFSAESMIRRLGTNRTYFSRMMRVEFDCTFLEMLTKYRIEHAGKLLRETDLSIAEIAVKCGFNDENSFSRRFRQIVGVPPSKCRGK